MQSQHITAAHDSHYAISMDFHPPTENLQLASRDVFVHAINECSGPGFNEDGPQDDIDNPQAHSFSSANVLVNDVVEWPLAAPDGATDNCGNVSTLASSKSLHVGGCAGAFTGPTALPLPLRGRPSQQTRTPPSSPALEHDRAARSYYNQGALNSVAAPGSMHACRTVVRTQAHDEASAIITNDFCHKSIGDARDMRNRSRSPERGRHADQVNSPSAPLTSRKEVLTSCGRSFDTFACYPPSGGYDDCDMLDSQQTPHCGTLDSIRTAQTSAPKRSISKCLLANAR